MEAVNTLILVTIPTEKLGAQAVHPVQEAVLRALQPGLGAETQVPQVVIIVGLHKALKRPRSPAGEGVP